MCDHPHFESAVDKCFIEIHNQTNLVLHTFWNFWQEEFSLKNLQIDIDIQYALHRNKG